MMPTKTITTEEFDALINERDALRGELKVVKVERDLGHRAYCRLYLIGLDCRVMSFRLIQAPSAKLAF